MDCSIDGREGEIGCTIGGRVDRLVGDFQRVENALDQFAFRRFVTFRIGQVSSYVGDKEIRFTAIVPSFVRREIIHIRFPVLDETERYSRMSTAIFQYRYVSYNTCIVHRQ